MQHGVDRQRQSEPHGLLRHGALARIGALVAGNVVGGGSNAVLDRDLHMIEAGLREGGKPRRGEADGRGDEVAVKAGLVRGGGDLHEVAARRRLAARQMYLQDAQRRRFAENARPGRGVELVLTPVERQRIGAIGTTERTAVRQLGKEAERRGKRSGTSGCQLTLAQVWRGTPWCPPQRNVEASLMRTRRSLHATRLYLGCPLSCPLRRSQCAEVSRPAVQEPPVGFLSLVTKRCVWHAQKGCFDFTLQLWRGLR